MTQDNPNTRSGPNVEAKEVLDTETTGQPPANANNMPSDVPSPDSDEQGNGESRSGTEVTAKEVLNTETTGEFPHEVNNVPN